MIHLQFGHLIIDDIPLPGWALIMSSSGILASRLILKLLARFKGPF